MKCVCGFEWTDEVLIKAFEEDEFGGFFRCPVDPDTFDGWNNCMGNVNPETGMWFLWAPLYRQYVNSKKQIKIEAIQSKHKYTLENYENKLKDL